MGLRIRYAVLMGLLVFFVGCGGDDTAGTDNDDPWSLNNNEDPDAGTDPDTSDDPDTGEDPDVNDDPDVVEETCDDGILNGDETDIDCGGSCDPCDEGLDCLVDGDCASDHCRNNVCVAPRQPLGADCDRDFECLSDQCEFIGEGKYCTESCETTCSDSGVACFDGWCTPLDFCENESGFGHGPGCDGAPCDQCHDDATCSQSNDTYVCICRDGYEGDGTTCTDIDECAQGLDSCDDLAQCTNTPGSYECECPDGYEGDGTSCTDIDECAEGLDSCHELAQCTNTPGSYLCECPDGFSGDGTTCTDINECTTGTHSCSSNAVCTNTVGSYECECNDGYEGDGHTCTDINECTLGTHSCHSNAFCVNYPGGYSCVCNQGYEGDGHSCTDIDECAEGTHQCHADAECTNTQGSYYCTCLPGFVGNGLNCSDVDECAQGTDTCDDNATCTNIPGSYECDCDYGYSGDGYFCDQDGDVCENPLLVDALPYTHESATTDANNDYSIEAGWCPELTSYDSGAASNDRVYSFTPTVTAHYRLRLESSFDAVIYIVTDCAELATTCVSGIDDVYAAGTEIGDVELEAGTTYFIIVDGWGNTFNQSGTYEFFIDFNECLNETDSCSDTSVCEKDGEGYECNCGAGYEFDGVDCVDIDECAEGTHSCDENATCTNTPGSYECECDAPYVGSGFSCSDPTTPGDSCEYAFEVEEPLPYEADGDTSEADNFLSFPTGACPGVSGSRGGSAPEQVYAYTPSESGNYIITVESTFDPVLYVVTDCSDIANSCLGASDAVGTGLDEVLELYLEAGTTYYIVVDGWSTSQGTYTLIVEEDPAP